MNQSKEIENRKPIWIALSEFYLDTELQQSDYNRIAKALDTSGLNITELKTIDLYEVFPVLKGNLISVAGAWNGFDEKWLYENCSESYRKKNKAIIRFKNRVYHWFLGRMTTDHWKKVEACM